MISLWRKRSTNSEFARPKGPKQSHRRSKFIVIAAALWASQIQALLPDEQNNVDVYQKTVSAVVNITSTTLRQDFFFEVVPQKGAGSGVIIKSDGYIVTNHHVVGNAVNVEVTLHDKAQYPAKVVGLDPDSDLAIIKINPKGKKLTAIEYGAPESLMVGQKVLAIGNPFGYGGSLSTGVISSLGRDIRATTGRLIRDIIQTDAAINPGNSGGPLLDSASKLIGINTQIFSPSGASHGIGFAISVKTLRRIVDQLIQFGKVLRPDLGIDAVGLGADLLEFMGAPIEQGVMILALDKGGPAAKAGLKGANRERVIGFRRIPVGGDIIFQVDETPVATLRDILDYISDKKAGESVTLHFYRGKTKQSAKVRLTVPADVAGESL